jgi:peptidoglycan lytic transglycosylase
MDTPRLINPSRVFPALVAGLLLFTAGCGGPTYTTRIIETPATRELKGYEKPYMVNGQRYDPLHSHEGFVQEGVASWYGADFHGKKTSNGETYDMYAMTAAHKTLPLGVFVRVTNTANGKQATVRVNDRGPFVKGRIIDLSYAAAKALGVVGPGTAPVHIEALGYQQTGTPGQVVYRQPASYDVGHFAVQVGAFTVAANADRLASQLRGRYGAANIQQGYVGGRLFYRVRSGDYTSLEAAEAARAQYERAGYPNSFVVAME